MDLTQITAICECVCVCDWTTINVRGLNPHWAKLQAVTDLFWVHVLCKYCINVWWKASGQIQTLIYTEIWVLK